VFGIVSTGQFSGINPGWAGLKNRFLGIVLAASCLCCHTTNSVKALNSEITEFSQLLIPTRIVAAAAAAAL